MKKYMYIIIGVIVAFVVAFVGSLLLPEGKTFPAACAGIVVGIIVGAIIRKKCQ